MPTTTIKAFIKDINNSDADGGGLWLPNIQRLFVWNEVQMCKLFDSIMRQYPLQSLLLWRTKEELQNRAFIEYYGAQYNLKQLYRPASKKTKRLILDGQQRLQTLFIGLRGSFEGKTLHFDVLSGTQDKPEETRYQFSFLDSKTATFPHVQFSQLIYNKKLAGEISQELTKGLTSLYSDDQLNTVSRNIERAKREFEVTETLIYQEIDSTDEDNSYFLDDVVEIFIRANSGGTKLSKSDLMFSLIVADWETADVDMKEFIDEINGGQFDFDRDFVLKSAMVLLDNGARYDVKKLRKSETRNHITREWNKIKKSIQFVRDFLYEETFIRNDKALSSYLSVIPLIYFYHHFPQAWNTAEGKVDYLLRVLLSGAFSGHPDGLIDKIITNIKNTKAFAVAEIFDIIINDQRSLKVSIDQLLAMGYGSSNIHLLFNIWHPRKNYAPTWNGNLPQVDHIFPRTLLKKEKVEEPVGSGKFVQRYSAADINQLANCMLLTASENGPSGKCDKPPSEWFKGKSSEYLDLHCIPNNEELWEVKNYQEFLEARKSLIQTRFTPYLRS